MNKFLVLILCISLLSCKKTQEINYTGYTTIANDSLVELQNELKEKNTQRLQKEKEVEKTFIIDSICRVRALEDAINESLKHRGKSFFTKKYEYAFDTLPEIEKSEIPIKLTFGNLLSDKYKHLIVRTNYGLYTTFNIYKLNGKSFELLVNLEELPVMTDTIMDVNGDGLKDLDIIWYPMSGCCLRNIHAVFLQNSDGTLTSQYEFINPTFEPHTKTIRGITYGHSGYTAELYKYEWNGLNIDTLEYIAHTGWEENDKRLIKIIGNDTINIDEVPKEYLTIEDYDWFAGDD